MPEKRFAFSRRERVRGSRYAHAGGILHALGGALEALRSALASLLAPGAPPSARSVLGDGGAEWIEAAARESLPGDGGGASALLSEPEERMRAIFEHSVMAILILERSGLIADANPAATEVLGLPLPALLRAGVLDLIAEADRADFQLELARLREGAAPQARREFAFAHPDGRTRSMEATFSAVRATSGETAFVALILEDVTERRRLAEQLRQAQKMEAIGRLAGGIAHDFNNIITAIQGHAQLARDEYRSRGLPVEEIDEVLRSTERAAALTRQLLAFSRKQPDRARLMDLNLVVSTLESMVGRLLGAGVKLESRLEADLAQIRADPTQVEQIVLNLLVNARDAVGGSGRIVVTTGMQQLADHDVIGLARPLRPGRYVTLAVADSGAGIPLEHRSRIFEPFFTTKEADRGTGLGLATVYGIVERANGSIRVESEPGKGTRFTIYLPPA